MISGIATLMTPLARHSDNIASIIHDELPSMAIAKAAVPIKNITHAIRADFQVMVENSLSNHLYHNQGWAILKGYSYRSTPSRRGLRLLTWDCYLPNKSTGTRGACMIFMACSTSFAFKSGIDENDGLPRGVERRALLKR